MSIAKFSTTYSQIIRLVLILSGISFTLIIRFLTSYYRSHDNLCLKCSEGDSIRHGIAFCIKVFIIYLFFSLRNKRCFMFSLQMWKILYIFKCQNKTCFIIWFLIQFHILRTNFRKIGWKMKINAKFATAPLRWQSRLTSVTMVYKKTWRQTRLAYPHVLCRKLSKLAFELTVSKESISCLNRYLFWLFEWFVNGINH